MRFKRARKSAGANAHHRRELRGWRPSRRHAQAVERTQALENRSPENGFGWAVFGVSFASCFVPNLSPNLRLLPTFRSDRAL
jgi:hypothetical protein